MASSAALLRSSVNLGALLCDGIGDAIWVRNERDAAKAALAYTILQAAGCRSFKTDYVACPSCGRTSSICNRSLQESRSAPGI